MSNSADQHSPQVRSLLFPERRYSGQSGTSDLIYSPASALSTHDPTDTIHNATVPIMPDSTQMQMTSSQHQAHSPHQQQQQQHPLRRSTSAHSRLSQEPVQRDTTASPLTSADAALILQETGDLSYDPPSRLVRSHVTLSSTFVRHSAPHKLPFDPVPFEMQEMRTSLAQQQKQLRPVRAPSRRATSAPRSKPAWDDGVTPYAVSRNPSPVKMRLPLKVPLSRPTTVPTQRRTPSRTRERDKATVSKALPSTQIMASDNDEQESKVVIDHLHKV